MGSNLAGAAREEQSVSPREVLRLASATATERHPPVFLAEFEKRERRLDEINVKVQRRTATESMWAYVRMVPGARLAPRVA